jgi:predicted metal-binding membrane protein
MRGWRLTVETDILTLSALVAAYVGVFKGFKLLPTKYLPLVALGVAAVFVLMPDAAQSKLILISSIGLGAAGAYSLIKNKGDGK